MALRVAETTIAMAAAASEPCTLERLCSSNFAKHLIAPLQRASSLLGSGDLWQMHADADEAEAAALAAQGGDAGAARWPWKMSAVVARIETSLSRFTRAKPPPSPTSASSKPMRSPIAASVTADLPAMSPKSPNPVSRRFKQRGAAESQIQFRLSPSHLASVAGASAELDLAAARGTRNAAKATQEEPVGRGAPAARRGRATLSMDEEQLSAWQQLAPSTTSDNVDGDSHDRNDITSNASSANLDLGNSFRADVAEQSSARLGHSSARRVQSGPLRPRSDSNRNSRVPGSPVASGSGRDGSGRAMVVGVSRSLTPPSSPTVKRFSFETYRQQQMAAQ